MYFKTYFSMAHVLSNWQSPHRMHIESFLFSSRHNREPETGTFSTRKDSLNAYDAAACRRGQARTRYSDRFSSRRPPFFVRKLLAFLYLPSFFGGSFCIFPIAMVKPSVRRVKRPRKG